MSSRKKQVLTQAPTPTATASLVTREVFGGAVKFNLPDHTSSSQRETWHRCRLKWVLSHAAGLVPKSPETRDKAIGHVVHAVLAQWYANVPIESRSLEILLAMAGELAAKEIQEPVTRILTKFWMQFGSDGLVARTEFKVSTPIQYASYVGYADLIYEDGKTLVIEDIKTSQDEIDPARYTLFDQKGRDYVWALHRMSEFVGRTVRLSYLLLTPKRASRVAVPFVREHGIERVFDAMVNEQRYGHLEPNYGGHCLFCEFKPLCAAHLMGRRVNTLIEADYTKREERHHDG